MNKQEQLKTTLLQLISTSVTLLVADYLMDSIRFEHPWVAIVTAIVLALLNAFLKPLLVLLTIPATIFTLGLFLLVINAATGGWFHDRKLLVGSIAYNLHFNGQRITWRQREGSETPQLG
jgi:uncharacterized membrane protein YvlD (DUF360 family)